MEKFYIFHYSKGYKEDGDNSEHYRFLLSTYKAYINELNSDRVFTLGKHLSMDCLKEVLLELYSEEFSKEVISCKYNI